MPLGITYVSDPEEGAREIRRNAERGFSAVTMPEQPHRPDFRRSSTTLGADRARLRETGTVLNLHIGSSGFASMPPGAPMLDWGDASDRSRSAPVQVAVERLTGPLPDLKIAMSEGGIGWVAMLIDRLDNIMSRSGYGLGWPDKELSPSDAAPELLVLHDRRSLDDLDPHTIGVENILFESDYPHGDGTWPDTQEVIDDVLGDLPVEEIRMITHENAASSTTIRCPRSACPEAARPALVPQAGRTSACRSRSSRTRKHPAREMAIHRSAPWKRGSRRLAGTVGRGCGDRGSGGASPLDPGSGHRGIEAITAFYDEIIAQGDLRFCIRQSLPAATSAPTSRPNRAENGVVSRTELVMVYRLNDEGKLARCAPTGSSRTPSPACTRARRRRPAGRGHQVVSSALPPTRKAIAARTAGGRLEVLAPQPAEGRFLGMPHDQAREAKLPQHVQGLDVEQRRDWR